MQKKEISIEIHDRPVDRGSSAVTHQITSLYSLCKSDTWNKGQKKSIYIQRQKKQKRYIPHAYAQEGSAVNRKKRKKKAKEPKIFPAK